MAVKYFKKYTGKSESISTALKEVGVKDPSLEYRKKIGKLNGISGIGTARGNQKMLSLLKKGKLIKSKDAKPAASKPKKATSKKEKFLKALKEEHEFIKKHGKKFFYSFAKAKKSFSGAKKAVKAGHKTGTTCVVPTRWALRSAGINPTGFYGKKGRFAGYGKKMAKYLKKITKGGPVGKTIEQAVNAGLLLGGDIIVFEGKTHTVTYSGIGYKVYDGGGAAKKRGYHKVGILLDYSKVAAWKNKKISGVLRWK